MTLVLFIFLFYSYLREVGFPDNVLEARVARLNLYRTLMSSSTNQNEPLPASSIEPVSMPAHVNHVLP